MASTNFKPTNKDVHNQPVVLTTAQRKTLQMSEEDIKHGRLISQEQLDEEDLKWLESIEQNASCCPPEANQHLT